MTHTTRQSKWLFWVNALLAGASLALLVADDRTWLRIGLTLLWGGLAVAYYRSWRIMSRRDSKRST